VAIWAVALSAHTLAQYRQPTEQEIERAKQQYRQPTDAEVDVAKKKYRQPTEAQLDRAAASQSPVNLDAIPMPKGKIDVEGLARAYEQNRQAFEKDKGYASDQPVLLVFVTLGMPEQTLRLLIDQASRTRAVMVLRGLKNASIRQTATHVQQLIGQKQVEWLNDCASGSCIAPNAFAAIAGDVSIDYALEAIERRAPRFSPEAQLFLKRIRG
jgi:conjugal transfer pilus assembly protein TrbC